MLRPRGRKAGWPEPGRRSLRRRHRRRDEGDDQHGGEQRSHLHTELEREHVRDERLRHVVHAMLVDRALALVPACQREATRCRGTPARGGGGKGSPLRCRRRPCAGSAGRRAPSRRTHASSAASAARRALRPTRRCASGSRTPSRRARARGAGRHRVCSTTSRVAHERRSCVASEPRGRRRGRAVVGRSGSACLGSMWFSRRDERRSSCPRASRLP